MDSLFALQHALGPECRSNVVLAPYTTMKIGGPADLFIEAKTRDTLKRAILEAIRYGVPYTILGGGSNALIGDKGVRGLVIRNMTREIAVKGMKGKYKSGQYAEDVYVKADSGVIFNAFVRYCIEEGYQGVEMHLGLPGTVGGAMYMNSKWTNPEGYVGDVVYSAEIITPQGEGMVVPRSYFQFSYGSSIIQKTKDVVLSATFVLKRSTREVLWNIANRSMAYRRRTQPQGVLSLGCTFQNISKAKAMMIPTPLYTTSAGYLIDHAGLKGYTIGRAQVSPVHANFIVNLGGVTAKEVLDLIAHIQAEVKKKFGVELEEEIVKIGEF